MLINRERALAVMDDLGVDALVATSAENVYYLSDYGTEHSFHFAPGGFAGAIFPRDPDKPATLLIQEWELIHLTQRPSWMPELRVLTGFDLHAPADADIGETERQLVSMVREGRKRGGPSRQRVLGETLVELGLGRATIAFDEVAAGEDLRRNELPDAQAHPDGVNVFRRIRSVKTPEEVALLRHAAKAVQTALEGVINLVQPGVTPRELLRYYRGAMAQQDGYGSHMTGGGGRHPWLSHPDMSYRFKEGDVIYLDPAGHYRHYWGDIGRAVIVGDRTAKLDELYGTLQECHRTVVPMMRDGASSLDIIAESRRSTAQRMPEGFVPLIHSLGIEHYDHPQSLGTFLSEEFTLEAGMVANFETLYFELGWGLIQLEDTYLIGDGEPERFQTFPQEALACPVL